MAEISIIVPVYNVEKYLENCIESILNQTFKDFELILVDDGSTDNSGKICDIYEKKDSRIKVIHKNNGGLSSARNAGLDIACGKYVGFVDSDDSIHPKMYEVLYNLIEKYKSDISCCNYKYTYDISNQNHEELNLNEVIEMSNIEAIKRLHDEDIGVKLVVAWNKLYNRYLFDNIRYEIGRIHEDEFIAHRILYECKKIIYIDNKLYYYLQREGSIMSKVSYKSQVDTIFAQSDRIKFCNKVGLIKMSNNICKIYESKFFNLYIQMIKEDYINKESLNKLRKDFISNLNILLRQKDIYIKVKISWLVFAVNPKIYKLIFIKLRNNKFRYIKK